MDLLLQARRALKASLPFGAGLLVALAPHAAAEPIFAPGLYESETREMPFRGEGERTAQCLTFPDADAFRKSTIAQYAKAPQFKGACMLSDSKPLPDGGFAFAMDCGIARTVVSFRFAKDLVTSATETRNLGRPENSSTVVTLLRRVGDCPGRASPGAGP